MIFNRINSKATTTLVAAIALLNGRNFSRAFVSNSHRVHNRHNIQQVKRVVPPNIIQNIQAFVTTTRQKMAAASSDSTTSPKKRVLVPIADDSEEIETTCITDTLVRFGAEVVVASVKPDGDLKCKMSRGINILADVTIDEACKQEWDLIALPGGMPGAEHLRDCPALIRLLEKQKNDPSKYYSAICAAPAVVLASKNLIQSGATVYPAPPFLKMIDNVSSDDVVVQGNLITSRGPGTALKFALKLGELLYGEDAAKDVASAMLVDL